MNEAVKEIIEGGVPKSLLERVRRDYVYLICDGLKGQKRLDAELILEMDAIVMASEEQRADRLRALIEDLNTGKSQASSEEGKGDVVL